MSSSFNFPNFTNEVIRLLSELNDFVSKRIPESHFSEGNLERVISELSNYRDISRRKSSYNVSALRELIKRTLVTLEYYENLLLIDNTFDNEYINEINEKISFIKVVINDSSRFIGLPSDYLEGSSSASSAEKRINDLSLKALELDAKINDFDKQIKAYNARTVMAQNSANESVAEFIESQQKIFKEEVGKLIDYLESKKNAINENEEKINSVISVLASNALSGSFMKNALKEEESANYYRRISIIVMLGVGVFFILNFIVFEFDLVTHDAWVNRIVIGLFFSFIIGYLVRQSAVHRSQQFMYQQKALDLNALSPYVANLPEEMQHKIKHQMAEKLFVSQGGSSCQDTQAFGVQEILGKLIDKLEFPKAPR